jgi:NAD(P)-dependent dehydrogenase (short-subunit alcohol dehydrogenase family)
MTDAQQLFDSARKQLDGMVNDVERHFDHVAGQLRDSFFTKPLAPPSRRLPPPTTWQIVERWVLRHKAITAAAVAFFVTGSVSALVYVKNRDSKRKRRARKSPSGARTDVVLVAGAVANPLTCALYLDLERRGFLVYVVTNTAEDAHYVRAQSRVDLNALHIDLVEPYTAQEQHMRFRNMLSRDHWAFVGAPAHQLNLKGLVLVPDTQSTPMGLEDISAEDWSDALNAKVLNTIATAQLFLPTIVEHKAKLLLLTPSVAPALKLPLHSLESTVYGALQAFISSLAVELKHDGVSISHLKLGDIDIPAVTAKQRRDGVPPPRLKPTPLRQLHDAVFDQLMSTRPRRILHIGRGSVAYDLIGSIMPPAFLAWMMGVRKQPALAREPSEERISGSIGSLTWEKVDEDA